MHSTTSRPSDVYPLVVGIILVAAMSSLLWFAPPFRELDSGEVVKKEFDPAHDEQHLDLDLYQNVIYHVSDRWLLTFRRKDEDNKFRVRVVEVSRETFDKYTVGDWIELKRSD